MPTETKNFNYDRIDEPTKQLSISVVFDINFNYLGEKKLKENKYEMFNDFIAYNGFYLQNKRDDKDLLKFTRFQIESIN